MSSTIITVIFFRSYLSNKYGLAPKELEVHAQCDMLDHVGECLYFLQLRCYFYFVDSISGIKS